MIRPELSNIEIASLDSQAEAKIYEACKTQLNEKYLVLHSISWIKKNVSGNVREGEADFVVFDPDGGFIVIEVKGGGIKYDALKNRWFSTDKHNKEHSIKDPFRQASSQKNIILNSIREHKDFKYLDGRILTGHAVFFPDLDQITQFSNQNNPSKIIGCRTNLNKFQEWIDHLSNYYRGETDKFDSLGKVGIAIVKDLYCKDVHVVPLLKYELEKEEEQRIKLTDEQARILTMLGDRKKALISGGAGTGKTLLAQKLATDFAAKGKKTLLVCYNNLLGNILETNAKSTENLTAYSYFKFVKTIINEFKRNTGRDLEQEAKNAYPSGNLWDTVLPFALALAAEELGRNFDAIVVDEAQDFHDEYWMGIEDLLSEDGYFYIFYDDNQRIYNEPTKFPINEPPYFLTHNCRNTEKIHKFAYQYYEGITTYPPDLLGHEVEFITAPSIEKQSIKIHSLILDLLQKESINTSQIKILVQSKKSPHQNTLIKLALPKPYVWKEIGESTDILEKHIMRENQGSIQIETIGRFKGLEADILILWGLENLDVDNDRELFYVATSRAKSRLFIVK